MAGKVKEGYLKEGLAEYTKRLRPHARLTWVQVAEEAVPAVVQVAAAEAERLMQREGERLLAGLHEAEYVIALDRQGEGLSSEDFARLLAELALGGRSRVAFVIGGTLGLHAAVHRRADKVLSLGPLTLPHQMVPLILLEQIYRAMKINAGEPYHR